MALGNTHDLEAQHHGELPDTMVVIDGDVGDYLSGTVLHEVLTGLANSGGGGFTPIVVYAECNTPGNTSATNGNLTAIDFDTFYDRAVDTIVTFPDGFGMEWNDTTKAFDIDEEGIWVCSLGVYPFATPGSIGQVILNVPDYGSQPYVTIASSGNYTAASLSEERTVLGNPGDALSVTQRSAGSNVAQADYIILTIIRTG